MPPQQTNHPFFFFFLESQNVLPKSKSTLSLKLGKTFNHFNSSETTPSRPQLWDQPFPHTFCEKFYRIMGNHSTKLVEKPENYEEHEYQGGLHIFNIEGNVEGMYMVAYFGIVFLFVMVFLPLLRHVLRVSKNSSPREESETEDKPRISIGVSFNQRHHLRLRF
jgi:hypothetical protein